MHVFHQMQNDDYAIFNLRFGWPETTADGAFRPPVLWAAPVWAAIPVPVKYPELRKLRKGS
jgi:hypothetical protein